MIRSVPRPEGGAERDVCFYIHHNCPSARAMRAALDNVHVDELQFSVGLVGWEMPLNTPFPVHASNACGVCGSQPAAWFEWAGPRIWTP